MTALREPFLQLSRPGGLQGPLDRSLLALEDAADIKPEVSALFTQPCTQINRVRHVTEPATDDHRRVLACGRMRTDACARHVADQVGRPGGGPL